MGNIRTIQTRNHAPIVELLKKEQILYKLARIVRNTDGLHPSTSGPMIGKLLLELRLLDGDKYDRECIQSKNES